MADSCDVLDARAEMEVASMEEFERSMRVADRG